MKSASQVWDEALVQIRKTVSATGFNTAFTKVSPVFYDGDKLVLKAEHELYKNMIESVYLEDINHSVYDTLGKTLQIEIILDGEDDTYTQPAEPVRPVSNDVQLNPRFTFESFVVGPNNEFAYSAAFAVTQGINYNPLLIYGGSGLGKTHLLHAVGNEILKNDPTKKVLYVTSEKFVNSFIESIHTNSNKGFRDKFRTIDVLLIDDIQFFAKKEGTQEEFFHTFNELINQNKQIVLTSDRPPKDISPLEERLRTRLSGGLMTDVQPPNYETRLAIIHKKGLSDEFHNVKLPEDIFDLVASKVKSNIREMEGALRTIIAFSDISKKQIDLDTANKILDDYFSSTTKRKIDADFIIKEVGRHFNIEDEEIKGKKRDKEFTYPRQVAMYICRELTHLSLPEIGNEFGRDHSTVMHSIRKIKQEMEQDIDKLNSINDLIKNIKDSED